MRQSTHRTKDRRIQRTQSLLREALHSLIGEKPYDDIVVKEILERANVGRSTFYSHFRGKDELLVEGIHDMLRPVLTSGFQHSPKRSERIVAFSLAVFEHLERHLEAASSKMTASAQARLHARVQHVLIDVIADELRQPRYVRVPEREFAPELIGEYVASTFILVLNWWVDSHRSLRAREVNDLFRSLVLPTLTEILD